MNKGIYNFSFLVALTNLISCILGGITLLTSVIRSVVVFLGTLLIFAVFMHLLKWGLNSNIAMEKKSENQDVTDE